MRTNTSKTVVDERPDPIRAAASRVSGVAEEPSPEIVSKGAGDGDAGCRKQRC